jgi:uncharacterized repeat protein (TIGR03803 family)
MSKTKRFAPAVITSLVLGFCANAQAAPLTFTSLYSFPATTYYPGQVLALDGQLYGITDGGGDINGPPGDLGVIFKFDPATNTESTLWTFSDNFQGFNPTGLIATYKKLRVYTLDGGQLEQGFTNGSGTIFDFNTANGKGKKLFDFIQVDFGCTANDLLSRAGQFYGTCNEGLGPNGTGDSGILFQVNATTGAGQILYAFSGGADGGYPAGALVYDNGVLYGAVTAVGGNDNGGIFAYTLATGAETIVHQFVQNDNNTEGGYPSGVTLCDGMVAGFNEFGGAPGLGTVFSFNPSTQNETTLYTFQNNDTDGTFPFSWAPVCMGKSLYGAAARGGAGGDGALFEINMKTGAETILHSFSGSDGSNPYTSLTKSGGTLYGTTTEGGANGGGTIFKLAP